MADYESNIKINVDDSELNDAEKRINNLKDKKVKVDLDVNDSGINKTNEGLKQVGQSAKGSGKSVDGLSQSMGKVSKNTLAAAVAYKTFNATTKQLKEAISEVEDLNTALTTVHMTMQNMTNADLSGMKSQILDMSNELSTYVKTVSDAVEIYANANESINTIMQKAEPTVLLATASKTSASEAADTVQGILNQFKMTDDAAMRVVDTLEGLSAEMKMDFAKGIQNASDAVKVSGSVIDSAGMSFERYAAIVSATSEATRSSGSILGNSFKTIASRITRSKDGEATSEDKSNAEKAYNSIGINLRQADGDIQDLSITIDALNKVWGTLTDNQKDYIAFESAGIRQKSVFIAMMDNYNRALQLEQAALESSGTAMRINETRAESIDGKLQKLSSTMSKLYNDAIDDETVMSVIDLADGLAEVVDKMGLVQGAFAALGTAGLAKGIGLLTNNWQKLINVIKSPVSIASLGVGAAVSVYSAYQQHVEELLSKAQKSAQDFSSNTSSLDEQISKVEELKASLASGTLSEEQSYQTKSQLLDIQNQLINTYGNMANGIDLVNGSLEKEIALMNELSVANANQYLNENKSAIDKAKNQMTKDDRKYQLGVTGRMDDTIGQEIKKVTDEFKDAGITLEGTAGGSFQINFVGDASGADTTINEFMNRMRELQTDLNEKGMDTHYIDNILNAGEIALSNNQKILDDYQEIYNTALQSEMMSKGFGEGKPATVYKDYAEAIEEYNQALLSGDDSKITSAKSAFDDVQSSVESILDKYPEYTSLFDEVGLSLDTASIKANDFKEALSADSMSDVMNALKDMKDVDLNSMNFDDDVTSDSEDALSKIVDKAIELGIVSDDSSESISSVVDILAQLGYVASDSSNGVNQTAQSISDLSEKTQGVVNDINAVMGVLSGQKTGQSISLEDFNSDELKDYQSALEYVNGSMQLNADKVQEITKVKAKEQIEINNANKAMKQSEYLKNAGEIEQLRSKLKNLTEGTAEYNDTKATLDSLMSSNEAISAECAQYDLLTSTIKEATSAYSNWLTAQSGSDYGDMFNDSLDVYARIMDTYNSDSDIYGDFGSKKFDAAVDFIIPDSVDSEDTDKIKSYMDSFKKYLTFDDDGNATGMNIERFCKNAMDKGLMVLDESGENYQIAGQTTMEDFAEGLNMSLPMVQSFFDEMQLKGGDFDWADEAIQTVGDLGVKAYESAEALRSIEGNSDLEIKMDVSDIENVDDKVSALDDTIAQMNDLKAKPDVDASEVEHANDVIQYCVSQKQQLSAPIFMSIDTSQVDGELGEVIGLIQQLQSAKNELDIQASVGADTSEAQGKVDSLVSKIQSKDATIKATIGDVDTSNVDTILAGVSSKTAKVWVDLGVKDSAITGYTPENKTATVTYTLNSTAVDQYDPKNLKRTVTYTVVTNGELPKVNGTAHASGTAHVNGSVKNNPRIGKALASGEWGVNKDETALVGELGQELIVYGNKFWTVGDNGAEFTAIPKGAIVFNHKQTEEIFKNGYVTSDGGRGHAYASGTAYVTGGISVSNAKKSSASSSSSKSTTPTTPTDKTITKTKKSLDSILKSLEKLFDWIEVRVQRLEDKIDLNLAKADNATTYTSKNAYIQLAQNDTATLLATQQKAVTKYTNKANAVAKKVGLSSSLKKKVDNGTIDIQSLSENNKKRVEEYMQWVEKANAAKQAIEDLKQQQKELAQQKLDNIIEQYDTIVNLAESAQKVSETMVDYYTSMGKSVDSNEAKKQIQSQMTQQNKITTNLQAQSNAYTKELANAAKVFGTSSNEYREAAEKLNDINASLYESKTAYNDLNKQLKELDLSAIQYAIDNLEAFGDKMKNIISLLQKRGQTITEEDYTKQINNNNSQIEQYYKDRQNRIDTIAQNGWEVGSEQYQEYYEAIMKDEDAIYSLLEANEDLKASIVELRWEPFNDLQKKLSQAIDDYDFLRSLLNEEGFYDENGALTSEGQANIALIGKAMATAKQQITDYREALNKLQEEYENGNITLDEYNERSREYIETIQDSVSAVKDYEKALIDMYKTQLQKENDALQENIDLQKERISKEKEYWDYAESLKDKTKTVNEIEAQIAALKGVNNSQAKAELKRLQAQLTDAQKSLDDTKRDHQYDMMQEGYDLMSENAEKSLNSTLDALESNSAKQQEVVNEMLDQIKNSYSSAYSEINEIISETGTVISKEAQDAIDSLNDATDALNTANSAKSNPTENQSSNQASGINTDEINTSTAEINNIESSVSGDTSSEIQSKTDEENARKAEEAKLKAEQEAKAKAEADAKAKAEEARKKKLSNVKTIIKSLPKSDVKKGSSAYKNHSELWRYIFDKSGKYTSEANMKKIAKALGITNLPDDINSTHKKAILKELKAVGYKKGTKRVPKDQLAWTQEDGEEIIVRPSDGAILTPLKQDDIVFNNEQTRKIWDLLNGNFDVSSLVNLNTGSMLGQLPEIVNQNDMSKKVEINQHFDSLMTIEGNVYKDAIPGLEKQIDKMIPHISDKLGVYVKNEMRL